jgi:SsrA-binding protein
MLLILGKGGSALAKQKGVKEICGNRKAFHEYFVLERFEAGIELAGTEVKSVRGGNVNLKDSFCTVKDGELFLRGMHISPYEHGNIFNKDPVRPRRLLMHKREILKLNARVMQDGVALIPLSLYFKDSRVKVELGLCKGKKLHDKRDSEADRQAKRDIDRAMKERTNS